MSVCEGWDIFTPPFHVGQERWLQGMWEEHQDLEGDI
jgi:hypothetical protein